MALKPMSTLKLVSGDAMLVSPGKGLRETDKAPAKTETKEIKDDDELHEVDYRVYFPSPIKTALALGAKDGIGGGKEWSVPIAGAANLVTSGSGFINATFAVASVAATSYFVSLATLFDEFYVESVDIWYQPFTRYQVLPSTSSTEGNGSAVGVASLFLDTTVYTNLSQMPSNPTFELHHSSSPFKYKWKNNVTRKKAMSSEPTSTQAALGWVRTNATPAQYYGGLVQLLGTTTYAMHASTGVGVLAYRFNTFFRAKA